MTPEVAIVPIVAKAIYDYLLPAFFLLAFLTFSWGTFQYFVQGSADEEIKETSKALMLYGLVAFLIMLAIWVVFTLAFPLR